MTRRGRPRDTPAQRILRQCQRKARRSELLVTAQFLRDAAVLVAEEGPRRSLRILLRTENELLLAEGKQPLYAYILFGESDWNLDDGFLVGLRVFNRSTEASSTEASAATEFPPPE